MNVLLSSYSCIEKKTCCKSDVECYMRLKITMLYYLQVKYLAEKKRKQT